MGCIILRSWRLRHQLYRYLHDVYQDACNVMSLADFLVISAEAVSAFVNDLFDDGSDEGQGGASTRQRNNMQVLRQSVVTTRLSGGRSSGTSTTSSQRKSTTSSKRCSSLPWRSTRPSTGAISSWKRRPQSTWKRMQSRVRRRDAPSKEEEWGLHDSVSVHGAKITKFIDCLTTPAPNKEGRALPPGQLAPRSTADPQAKPNQGRRDGRQET